MQRGPEGKVVISLVEHIGGARFERHGLGRRDVVDALGGDSEPDRPLGFGIEAHMQLHAAPCPGLDRLAGEDARRIDQSQRILPAAFARKRRREPRRHCFEQACRPPRIGIAKRRTPHRPEAQMRQHTRMALDDPFQIPQRARPRQLCQHHRHHMTPGRELTLRTTAAVSSRFPLEPSPRHRLEQLGKHRRLVAHGLGSPSFIQPRSSQNTVESKPCNPSTHSLTGQQWA